MASLQGVFFLLIGVGLVTMVHRSLDTAWLPFGPNGLRGRVVFRRHEQPVGYWIAFVLYGAGGLWCTYAGVAILMGWMAPLPLR